MIRSLADNNVSAISDIWNGVKSFVSDIPTIVKTQAQAGGKMITGDFGGAKDTLVSLKQLPIDAASKVIADRQKTTEDMSNGYLVPFEATPEGINLVFALAKNENDYKNKKIDISQYASTKAQIQTAFDKGKSESMKKTDITLGDGLAVMNELNTGQYTQKSTSSIPTGITMSENTGIAGGTTGITTTTMNTTIQKITDLVKRYWYIVVLAGFAIWYFFLRKKR